MCWRGGLAFECGDILRHDQSHSSADSEHPMHSKRDRKPIITLMSGGKAERKVTGATDSCIGSLSGSGCGGDSLRFALGRTADCGVNVVVPSLVDCGWAMGGKKSNVTEGRKTEGEFYESLLLNRESFLSLQHSNAVSQSLSSL